MSTVSLLPVDACPVNVLPICAWPDPVIDALGHDPRSTYVEMTGTEVRFVRGEFPNHCRCCTTKLT